MSGVSRTPPAPASSPSVQSTPSTSNAGGNGVCTTEDNSSRIDALTCEAPQQDSCTWPTDPAAQAARDEVDRYFARPHTAHNWVTANGYGAFDLLFVPATGLCTVTVDIEFDFQDAPPSVLMKYVGALDIANMVECVWTDEKKEQFKSDMIDQVYRVWSDTHELVNIYEDPDLTDGCSPQWSDVSAIPEFFVNPVDSGGHFKVKVLALPAADSLRSGVIPTDHDSKAGVAPNRASPSRKTVGGEVADKDFVRGPATLNSHDVDKKGIGSSFDGTSYTVVKGDTLSSIAKKLYGDAKQWKTLYDANKSVVGPDPNKILPGQSLTLKVPDTHQVTVAHEFGHMIGLDDQYAGGGAPGGAGAVNDDGTRLSSVPAEEHRIMDGGEVVLNEHMSSVVDCLDVVAAPAEFVST